MTEIAQTPAPDATHFRVGDVWMAPGGFLHRVVSVHRMSISNGSALFATLRAGSDGAGGRKSVRSWDAIGAHSGRPWIRKSWGGQP